MSDPLLLSSITSPAWTPLVWFNCGDKLAGVSFDKRIRNKAKFRLLGLLMRSRKSTPVRLYISGYGLLPKSHSNILDPLASLEIWLTLFSSTGVKETM